MEYDLKKYFVESLTDYFVESFKNEQEFKGTFFSTMYWVGLPSGVNADDPRVKDILECLNKVIESRYGDSRT